SPFEWGKDNWNFNNSSYQGYFPRSTYRNQISSSYLDTLKNNLTNSEYQCIFVNSAYHTAWLDESWGGSCYGMTSLTLLSKSGLFPYSSYKSGAAKLHDLNYPKNDSQVSSVVTYYQMLQVKNVIQQQYRSVPLRTNETNIKDIIAKLDDNPVVAIGFSKSGWGGHAILATGYEYGNWTWDDISYQGCIRICDPNCSMSYNSEYNIYFNTHTYNWTIPAYDVITSVNGAKFNFIGASVADINQGGYLSGTANRKIDGYIARIDAPAIASNRTVTKVVESNGAYMNNNAAPGEIIEDESYFVGGESQGITGYNLLDADASYRVSQQTPVELRLSMDYENCDLYGSSMAGRSVLFDKSGYVEVNGDSAKYQLGMTFDRDYPTDWFSIAATGYGADAASLRKASEGYVLSADHLEKITVTANNKSAEATAKIASAEDSVLLYEINKNTIGVRVDKDGNGIYETDLMILGDTDGNRTLDTVDATLVQRRSLGLETALTEEELLRGDTDGSKVLDITDVTAIQYATINLETTYPVGSFVM
ncbi:MAG: hypothetical protein IJU73_01940, partial [Ruminococcus sp.]|nr:hypothetical protein [Ruminococcus sp.]